LAATASQTTQQDRDTVVAKAWNAQERLENRLANIGKGKYGRVLRMSRKPTPEEYRKAAMVSAIGVAILGVMGFLIYYAMSFIPQ
jgi:protein transport protein SEC61 subunit gamma-like protein